MENMKKIFLITGLILLLLVILAFAMEPFFFPQPNRQVYENCGLVQIGMTYDEVVKIMGKPASERQEDNTTKLLYLAGGIQTEAGIGFEFKDGLLITKNCGVDNPT